MESKEYMEIRNALIVLTKISSVFPVIRKSGVNLEKRVSPLPAISYAACIFLTNFFDQVAKLKGDEREDLKVLATGVAAALAARKVSLKMHVISVFPLCSRKHLFIYNIFKHIVHIIYLSTMFSIVQSSWLSEEEFGMGHIDLKPATTRSVPGIWKPIKLFLC